VVPAMNGRIASRRYVFVMAMAVAAGLWAFPPLACPDIVYLKNGNKLEGLVEKEDAKSVEVNFGAGSITLTRDEIARIERAVPEDAEALRERWKREKKQRSLKRPEEELRRMKAKAEWELLEKQREKERILRDEFSPKEILAEVQNGHFIVHALLNGKVRVRLTLDSGATLVTLTRRIADKLGLDLSTARKDVVVLADGRRTEVVRIQLASLEILSAVTGNLNASVPNGVKAERVNALTLTRANDVIVETDDKIITPDDGLLGTSFLNLFQLKLDYQNGKITFQKNPQV
jgi:clan AA aspartic protease (TIGR02281 family)